MRCFLQSSSSAILQLHIERVFKKKSDASLLEMRWSRSELTWSILLLCRVAQLFSVRHWLHNLLSSGIIW